MHASKNFAGIKSIFQVHHNSLAPPSEEKAHGSISTKTYIKFFTAGGNLPSLFIVSVFFLLGEVHYFHVCMYSSSLLQFFAGH